MMSDAHWAWSAFEDTRAPAVPPKPENCLPVISSNPKEVNKLKKELDSIARAAFIIAHENSRSQNNTEERYDNDTTVLINGLQRARQAVNQSNTEHNRVYYRTLLTQLGQLASESRQKNGPPQKQLEHNEKRPLSQAEHHILFHLIEDSTELSDLLDRFSQNPTLKIPLQGDASYKYHTGNLNTIRQVMLNMPDLLDKLCHAMTPQ